MTEDAEVKCLAVLLHLSSLVERWQEGPFRAGFETAIEEAAAYIEHLRAEDAQAMTREPKLTDSLSDMARRRTAYRLHTLRYRDDESDGFECCHPITCQFPRCDCDRVREEEEAERRAEERHRLENEAMAEHFRKRPHG